MISTEDIKSILTLPIGLNRQEDSMSTKAILTPPGISSFLNLDKPRAIVEGGEPRFSLTLIFDKAAQRRPEFMALEKAIDEEINRRWPNKKPAGLRSPFRDGAEKEGVYEGYKSGDIFISPWSKEKPGVVDIRRQEVIDFKSGEFFAGWTARANVRPFAYDQGGNKGCGLFLDSVQFLRPGKRLDGRKAATESFPDDELEEEPI